MKKYLYKRYLIEMKEESYNNFVTFQAFYLQDVSMQYRASYGLLRNIAFLRTGFSGRSPSESDELYFSISRSDRVNVI